MFGTLKSKILFKAQDEAWTWITMEKYHTRKVFIDLNTNSIPLDIFFLRLQVRRSALQIHLRTIYSLSQLSLELGCRTRCDNRVIKPYCRTVPLRKADRDEFDVQT